MKRLNLKPREIRLAIFTAIVVFTFLNYLLVLPWWKREQERVQECKKLQGELAYRKETAQHTEGWRKELSTLVQKKESKSPNIESQEMWMKYFESLASKSGVQLLQRRSAPFEGKSNSNRIRVDCTFQGNFESIVKFLNGTVTDASHPQIEGCQLSPMKAGEDKLKGQVTLTVSLKISSKS